MARCIAPFSVTHKTKGLVQVPCNKCPHCYARRISGWSYRLLREARDADQAHFITLTYNTTHVPITPEGKFTLSPRDLQLYFKRLRKTSPRLKYYAVGEYGSELNRPHYHAIVFNAEYTPIADNWQINGQSIGDIYFGDVNGASIGYVIGYINKVQNVALTFDQEKPFSRMSKGLGKNYINDMIAWHYSDLFDRVYCPLPGGEKIAMPRYYKEKIYAKGDRTQISYMFEKEIQASLEIAMQAPDYFYKTLEAHKQVYKRAEFKSRLKKDVL